MDDTDFVANYRPGHLYINPGKDGAYATIADESEVVLGEVDVTERFKLAVSAFYVKDKADFGTFKLTKLKFHKLRGWEPDGHIHVNYFHLAQIHQFLSIIANVDLSHAQKARLSLDNLDLGALASLLNSTQGPRLIQELANSPDLHHDIYAVAAKREALQRFKSMLAPGQSEPDWQSFFEANRWIFGHGLNYVFLDKVGQKLEARTTGNSYDQSGKTVDALMRTRAEISQYVLIEIKKADTPLLRPGKAYRSGCYGVSDELSNAVTQIQKAVFEFSRTRFRERTKDTHGNDLSEEVYAIEPRSFLVIGNLSELRGNNDKVTCFELYRRNVKAPEILTFDELFHRAKFIVANLAQEEVNTPVLDDDVPF
jgi:hypothetical protein